MEISAILVVVGDHQYQIAIVRDLTERKKNEKEREELIAYLQKVPGEVKTLKGLLSICSHCKKIRDDKGYCRRIESYISSYSDAEFSHGICPECPKKNYSEISLYEDE